VRQSGLGDRNPAQLAGGRGVADGELAVRERLVEVAENPRHDRPQAEQPGPRAVVGHGFQSRGEQLVDLGELLELLALGDLAQRVRVILPAKRREKLLGAANRGRRRLLTLRGGPRWYGLGRSGRP
jgi:hypothetical protein